LFVIKGKRDFKRKIGTEKKGTDDTKRKLRSKVEV
jgi:hypothetical protein|tara:strand:- start:2240 stop:2344 length:105 start_codon:yes stop_codon:yes gene_type:complete